MVFVALDVPCRVRLPFAASDPFIVALSAVNVRVVAPPQATVADVVIVAREDAVSVVVPDSVVVVFVNVVVAPRVNLVAAAESNISLPPTSMSAPPKVILPSVSLCIVSPFCRFISVVTPVLDMFIAVVAAPERVRAVPVALVEIFPVELTWKSSPSPTVKRAAGEVSPIPTLPVFVILIRNKR